MDVRVEEVVVGQGEVVKPEWRTPELKVLSVADAENGLATPSSDLNGFS